MSEITLTEDERDVLQELVNVAYGNAASLIAEMLDAFASLSVPNIDTLHTEQLIKNFQTLGDDSYFFATQSFIGEFNGECAFFINNKSAQNLAKHLELENAEDIDDAILELTNVLTSSLTTRLAQEMNTEVKYSTPSISQVPLNEMENNVSFKKYSQVIVINTQLNFQDQQINGDIFILTKDGSIEWLKNRLNNILEAMI